MISIVIPNFNGVKDLKTVFESISNQTYSNYKVILVDNGSDDESVSYTEKHFPSHMIIRLDKNYGFSKAVNHGVKYAINELNSDYILLLNNDIELSNTFLDEAVKTFSDVNDAGFIAVKMMNYFDRSIIDNTGDFIKSNGGSPLMRGFGETDTGQYDKPGYIFGACAGAAFYRIQLFKDAGLFDEDFFAYLEDVDLSFRFQLAGYKCYYNPKIICYHKRGETTKKFSGWETYYTEKNLVSLRLKNYPSIIYLKYFPLFFISRVRRFLKFFLKYPADVFKSAIKGYAKGVTEIPSAYKKRRQIQKNKKVSSKYIESLFV
ncbi:MAG: glycosyltransferase family 2 protein [bacterium]